jgi:hypothetical protein
MDSQFEQRMEDLFQKLNENEKIVGQSIFEDGKFRYLLVTTQEEKKNIGKNLLLEEIQKGDMPDVFGIKKDEK